MKRVSVILPSYNYDRYLSQAMDSVLMQTYENWELIVVDDGSRDASVSLIESYQKKYPDRIRLFFHEDRQNQGLAKTYQLGLKQCTGDYIAFIEADDVWYPDSLAAKFNILEKFKEVVVVHNKVEMFGNAELISELDQKYRWRKFLTTEIANEPFYAHVHLLRYNFLLTFSSFMAKKEAMKDIDFTVKHDAWIDWWLLAQLSLKGSFYYVPRVYTRWRVHSKSYNMEYSRSIDDYRAGCSFQEEIFKYMKTHLEQQRGERASKLLSQIEYVLEYEKKQRIPRWVKKFVKGVLKKILPGNLIKRMKNQLYQRLCPRLLSCLDSPITSEVSHNDSSFLDGWLFLSDGTPIEQIEGFCGSKMIGCLDYGLQRKDVHQHYPDFKEAKRCGFSGYLRKPLDPSTPLYVVAWDVKGRWYEAFEFDVRREVPLGQRPLQQVRKCVGRYLFLRELRRKQRNRMKPFSGINILIAGKSKTGTTALFYKIKNSLPHYTRSWFEPLCYVPSHTDSYVPLLSKILIQGNLKVDHGSFDIFDKRILIVRDPRDRLISAILYHSAINFFQTNRQQCAVFIQLLKKKESCPNAISVLDLHEFGEKHLGLEIYNRIHSLELFMEHHRKYPDSFVFKYEDLIDGNLEGLEQYLGFKLADGFVNGVELAKVARTKSYGDWRNWFLREDVKYFRPLMTEYMKFYGYADDWNVNPQPGISPRHCTEFVEKLIRNEERQRDSASSKVLIHTDDMLKV